MDHCLNAGVICSFYYFILSVIGGVSLSSSTSLDVTSDIFGRMDTFLPPQDGQHFRQTSHEQRALVAKGNTRRILKAIVDFCSHTNVGKVLDDSWAFGRLADDIREVVAVDGGSELASALNGYICDWDPCDFLDNGRHTRANVHGVLGPRDTVLETIQYFWHTFHLQFRHPQHTLRAVRMQLIESTLYLGESIIDEAFHYGGGGPAAMRETDLHLRSEVKAQLKLILLEFETFCKYFPMSNPNIVPITENIMGGVQEYFRLISDLPTHRFSSGFTSMSLPFFITFLKKAQIRSLANHPEFDRLFTGLMIAGETFYRDYDHEDDGSDDNDDNDDHAVVCSYKRMFGFSEELSRFCNNEDIDPHTLELLIRDIPILNECGGSEWRTFLKYRHLVYGKECNWNPDTLVNNPTYYSLAKDIQIIFDTFELATSPRIHNSDVKDNLYQYTLQRSSDVVARGGDPSHPAASTPREEVTLELLQVLAEFKIFYELYDWSLGHFHPRIDGMPHFMDKVYQHFLNRDSFDGDLEIEFLHGLLDVVGFPTLDSEWFFKEHWEMFGRAPSAY